MKTGMKRTFSMLLALVMVFSMVMPAYADGEVQCDCGAAEGAEHSAECAITLASQQPDAQNETGCTGLADCAADSHNEGCLSQQSEVPQQPEQTCTKAADCPLTEGHEADCQKLLNEQAAADAAAAEAKKQADIAAVQAMIDALTPASTPEELLAVETAISNLLAAYSIADPNEVLNMDNYYLLSTAPDTCTGLAGCPAADGEHSTTCALTVATVGDKGYTSAQAAFNAVVGTATNMTVIQKPTVNHVIDGANQAYSGTIYIKGNNPGTPYTVTDTVTIRNIAFSTSENSRDFINSDEPKDYAHNVTISGCTFTGPGGDNSVVAARFRQDYNITMSNCTVSGMHSAMWATGGGNGITIDTCSVENSLNGFSFDTAPTVTVCNTNINVSAEYGYGLRTKGSADYALSVENCKITADVPVLVRNATSADYKLTIDQASELTASNSDSYQVIFSKTDYSSSSALSKPDVAVGIIGNDKLSCYPIDYVAAMIGNSTFSSFEAALAEANANGGTIVLMDSITLTAPVTVTGTVGLDLNSNTISYESTVQGEAMFTNKGDFTVTDSGTGGKISFCFSGTPDTSYGTGNYGISNCGNLTVSGGTIVDTTASMNHAHYVIDNNSTIGAVSATINGGSVISDSSHAMRMFVNGNKNVVNVSESGSISGNRAIWLQLPGSNAGSAPEAEINISGGSLTSTDSTYNMAIYSYSDGNSFENTSINVTGGTVNGDIALCGGNNRAVAEKLSITGGTVNDFYSFADTELAKANITVGPDARFTSGAYAKDYLPEGYTLADNGDGTCSLEEAKVAQIGSKTYGTLKAALAAVQPGETVELLEPVTATSDLSFPANIKFQFNGNSVDMDGYTASFTGKVEFLDEGSIIGSISGEDNAAAAEGFFAYVGYDGIWSNDSTEQAKNTYGLYVVKTPIALPTASTKIFTDEELTALNAANEYPLTYAMTFTADEISNAQFEYYKNWYADYVIVINKDLNVGTDTDADGYLGGQYESFSKDWLFVPDGKVDYVANTPVKIMETAVSLMLDASLQINYEFVMTLVKEFDCGLYFSPEFLANNPDLEVTLELQMSNPDDPDEVYTIGDVNKFHHPDNYAAVVINEDGEATGYQLLSDALAALEEGSTLKLMEDATIANPITVTADLTIEGVAKADGTYTTLTYTGSSRAITVEAGVDADLTVRNLDIVIPNYSQRGINYSSSGTLTLENVNISDGNGGSNTTYAINLPSGASGAEVNISDSDIRGKIALNIWGEGIATSISDSELYTIDDNSDEDYAVIKFNNDGTNTSGAWSLSLNGGSLNYIENGSTDTSKPAIYNSSLDKSLNNANAFTNNGCTLNGRLAESIAITTPTGNGDFYSMESLQEAVDTAVQFNVSIELLRNVDLNEELVLSGDVVLYTKGKTLSIGENGSISFEGDATTLTIEDLEGTAEQLAAFREALPGLCISKGSIIIAKNHTAPTGASCADAVECTVCGEDMTNANPALHSLRYSLQTGKTNVIVEECNVCGHEATAKIDLKDAKKSSFAYTGKPIEALAVSYSVKSNTSDAWLGGALDISYLNASNEATNVDPGIALGKISKTGSDNVTATASMSFDITLQKLDSWEHSDYYRDSNKSLSFTIETDYNFAPGYVVTLRLYNSADKLVATVPQASMGAKLDKNGDIVVTVPASIMSKLSTGRYTMKAELVSPSYDDADEMIVVAETEEEFRVRYPRIIPSTGDSANFLLWGGMLLAATAALGGTAIVLKKSKKQK